MKALIALYLALYAITFSAPAKADEARPLYIEAQANSPASYSLLWRLPPNFAAQISPDLVLPADCSALDDEQKWTDNSGHWRKQNWDCKHPLEGRKLLIQYPDGNPNLATIFKANAHDGSSNIAVFSPSKTELTFPVASRSGTKTATNTDSLALMKDYGLLGFKHIWLGFDHLIFVACLIWIAGSFRRILATVTGFTLAHSVTLALSALDLVAVPIAAIEVLIALSIVLLATELARKSRDTITWRYPIAVSAGFGLLHGFGFAAVLNEIGLPQDGLISALLAFNIGIEIGQIMFAAAIIAITRALCCAARRFKTSLKSSRGRAVQPFNAQKITAYLIGTTAMFWMLERIA